MHLPLAEMIDLDAERQRLGKELENLRRQIARSEGLLANQNFLSKAPEEVVAREREKLAKLREDEARVLERLRALG